MKIRSWLCSLFCGGMFLAGAVPQAEPGLLWPTPNPAFQEGRGAEDFIQPTASGRLESGLFGCVRNGGARFHEGIDLFPLFRDRRREATDPIYAVLPGRVAYISRVAGHSSYGRYLVVEHDGIEPAVHTVYAHLASITPGLETGDRVNPGMVLGVMGRSAGGYTIPRERAHLHFEIGFRLTDSFQDWFERQGFGSRNHHGSWNGMNMIGIDPLAYYAAVREGRVETIAGFLALEPSAYRLRVFIAQVPDFIRRYPALLEVPMRVGERPVAFEIGFTGYGLPVRWTPLYGDSGVSGRPGDVGILEYDREQIEAFACRRGLRFPTGGSPVLGTFAERTLQKIFGFR